MASNPSPRWTPTLVGVGAVLRAARQEAGLTRRHLAAAVGVSYGLLAGVEAEHRPPSVEVAERLCAALSLDAWRSAAVLAYAVDTDRLRARRGVRHLNRRGTPLPRAVLERIVTERDTGRSWTAIASALNANGVRTEDRGRWWASSVSRAAAAASNASSLDVITSPCSLPRQTELSWPSSRLPAMQHSEIMQRVIGILTHGAELERLLTEDPDRTDLDANVIDQFVQELLPREYEIAPDAEPQDVADAIAKDLVPAIGQTIAAFSWAFLTLAREHDATHPAKPSADILRSLALDSEQHDDTDN
jgi:transcriptional regulator with XRE-family HTH domain